MVDTKDAVAIAADAYVTRGNPVADPYNPVYADATIDRFVQYFIRGKAYCCDHYSPALEKHFLEMYAEWDGFTAPNKKFLNLFSRYVENLYTERDIPGGLTKGRLNDRSEKLRKTKNGLNFSIERHKNAWKHPENMHEVIQRWSFDIKQKRLKLVSERP